MLKRLYTADFALPKLTQDIANNTLPQINTDA